MFDYRKFVKFAAAAAAALMVLACGEEKEKFSQASEGNMIPDNAVMAMKIDGAQLFDKALGSPGSEVRQAWNMVKAAVPMYAASMGEMGTLAGDVVKDPAALGLRLDEPVVVSFAAELEDYAAEEGNVEVCLVALLDDSNAFVKVADAVMDLANEQAGAVMTKELVGETYTYYAYTPEEGVSLDMGVAEKSVVVRFKASTSEDDKSLKTSMLGLFNNGGPAKTDGLDAFYASKGDMTVWMDFEGTINMAMPAMEQMDPSSVAQLKAYMPMYKDASMVSDLVFKEGQTVLQFKMYGSEEMMAYTQKYNTSASDKYLDDIPFYPVLAVNVAIKDFAGMVDEMCKVNKEYKEVLGYLSSLGIDDGLLAGFPGNITFALDGNGIGQRDVPGMILMMDCGENVWELAKQYLPMVAEEVMEDVYCIEDMFCVAYAGGTLVAADVETFLAEPVDFDYAETYLGKEISMGGMALDLNSLPKGILDEVAEEIDYSMTGEELLEFFDSMVIRSSQDQMTATVTLNMGDQSENLLAKILSYAVQSVF